MQKEQPTGIAQMVDLNASSELNATKDNGKRVCENMVPRDKTKKLKEANAEIMRIPVNSIVGEAMGSFGKDTASMLQNMDKSQMITFSSAFAVQALSSMFNQLKENDANQDPTETLLRNVGNLFKKINSDKTLKPITTIQKSFAGVSQITEVMFSAIKKVLELPRNPSQQPQWFIKLLLNSDLADGSFLELRKEHLPMHKESLSVAVILLMDEHDQEYEMDYLFTAHKFHGNWRDIYLKHKLSWADALVFHQIGKCNFKVYIVRKKINGTTGISNMEILDNTHEAGTSRLSCDFTPTPHQLVRCNTSNFSLVPTCIQDSEAVVDFKYVKCFGDFKIYVNGEILDSKVPEPVRRKYYELCSGQKQFLHKNIKGLNSDLVAGLILQTITIVDEIKAANFATPPQELERMGNHLKSFEVLGLVVGFLRVKVNKLVKLSREHQFVTESKIVKLAEVEEQKRALGGEVLKLDELMKSVTAQKSFVENLGVDVDTLEKKGEQLDQAFKEVIDSSCITVVHGFPRDSSRNSKRHWLCYIYNRRYSFLRVSNAAVKRVKETPKSMYVYSSPSSDESEDSNATVKTPDLTSTLYSPPSSDESEDSNAEANRWDDFTGINPRMKKRLRANVKKLGYNKYLEAEAKNNTRHIKCDDAEVDLTGEPSSCVSVKFSAIKQAQELQRKLSQRSPSFSKVLLRSDISDGKFLDLPADFCNDHVSKLGGSLSVSEIHLLDGHEHEHVMKYSHRRHSFRGKWRDFYLKHKLSKGVVLVFHKIVNYKFMVFIVRNKISETDQGKRSISSAFSTSIDISVRIPEHSRIKYYALCASQKKFLHTHIKGLNSDLVVGMILQTIRIVDEIKAANFATPPHELERMGNNLKSFEDLGLVVGFLRVKVNKLVKLSRERPMAREWLNEKLAEIEEQENALKEEVAKLEELIKSVSSRKKVVEDLEAVVDTLKTKSKLLDVEFKNVVDSAW